MSEKKTGMKAYYRITFLIGLGFFTMGLMDPLYDTYVPIFLRRYIDSKGLIGLVMTLDNLFALLLIPLVSAISDRTDTRLGRRMPFIILTLPLTAVFFASIPFAAMKSFIFLVVMIFLLNVFKQAARGPVVALMPDIIPGRYRSEANGVINTMGGIAAIVGTVGLAKLMDVQVVIPGLGAVTDVLPFPIAGALVVLATLALFLFIKEKREVAARVATEDDRPVDTTTAKTEKQPIGQSLKVIFAEKDKSALWILLSVALWFIGYQGVLPFIGLYSVEVIGTSSGNAAYAAGMVGIAYALFAIPSGVVAHKHGRKKTIRTALLVLSALLALVFFLQPFSAGLGLSQTATLIMFWVMMFLFGMFWVSVITNSFPMLWQMANYENMGIYTGLYYTFSQAAAIASPPIAGAIIDLVGYPSMFLFAALCMTGAYFVMGLVTKGEVSDTETA